MINTVLVGMMGAGKTTVGRLVAHVTAQPFVDTDMVVAERAGCSIPEIFAAEGEAGFRRREAEAVAAAAAPSGQVVAVGGGAVLDPANVSALRGGGRIVWLRAHPGTLLARVGDDPARPLAGDIEELASARAPAYGAIADLVVDTDGLTPEQVAARLARWVWGELHDVAVGAGAVEELPAAGRVAMVAPATIAGLHGGTVDKALGGAAVHIEIPDGEAAKTPAALAAVWEELARAGISRRDLVVGVGGGAATDVAGLAAATYLRGIRWAAVPTSLLGMVDAAIGGKTAVDLPQGKNLAGAIWQPEVVVCDTALLATLPERELRSGWGEVAKYHFLGVPGVVDECAGGVVRPSDRLIRECVRYKLDVAGRDPREAGPRMWLNYGHTIGHAVEAASGLRLSHGEAVAVGLTAAADLGSRSGYADVRDETASLLAGLGLPTRAPDLRRGAVEAALRSDKKRGAQGLSFVLLEAVGRPVVVDEADLPPGALRAALDRVL